jgi:DNA-binding CsgD family transcriptional regulator
MPQRGCKSAERQAIEMIERVAYAQTREEIVREIFESLDRAVGFDTAMLLPFGGGEPITRNKSARQLASWDEGSKFYVSDVGVLARAAASCSDVVSDIEALSARQRDRLQLYAGYLRPWHISNLLALFVRRGSRTLHGLALCRHARSRFAARELERTRSLLPSVAVATRLLPSVPASSEEPDLTSRELQIVELVGRGLHNREIAAVCGTSPNTVRNQLVSIFEKLEVTTRGELVARAAASGLLVPFE